MCTCNNNIDYIICDCKSDILFVGKVLLFVMLLLEGQDGHTWKEHMHTLLQNVGVVH
jgi:hypothetical protein